MDIDEQVFGKKNIYKFYEEKKLQYDMIEK